MIVPSLILPIFLAYLKFLYYLCQWKYGQEQKNFRCLPDADCQQD